MAPKATVEIRSWEARWDGHCFDCERGIHKGQQVRQNDEGQTVHVQCPSERPVLICSTCFMQEPCEHSEQPA